MNTYHSQTPSSNVLKLNVGDCYHDISNFVKIWMSGKFIRNCVPQIEVFCREINSQRHQKDQQLLKSWF